MGSRAHDSPHIRRLDSGMRFKIVIAVLAVLAVAAGGWAYFAKSSSLAAGQQQASSGRPGARGPEGASRTRPVMVAQAQRETFGDHLEAIGTLFANESVTVTAKTQGIIRSIAFDDGQTVRRGEEIAAIDAGEQDAALNVELANLEQHRKELERIEALVKSSYVSEAKRDEQTALMKKAEANVAAARVRSGDRRILAPFSGIVGTRRISIGALVSPGTAVATLDDISVVKLDFAIPETFLASLRPGLSIEAVASAYRGETFKGEVISVDSRIDPTTRSVNIRALLKNPELRLRPGMLMIVDLIKDQREAVVIPEAALVPENDKQYVFVVGADNVANRVEITLGRRRMGFVEVLAGVKEGDLVVKEGAQDLRSGTTVQVVNTADIKHSPASEISAQSG
ncbi:MAG: efflux RND transporter periplasmic adaptor subunit [Rhodospirillaceae bacterium]|nr:efflux RND transporter periplasmic adaptor subunit [Rhodospirillaceae bacterium]